MSRKFPSIDTMLSNIYRFWISLPYVFDNSKSYWKERYKTGGNSGKGSYNELAEFKAHILNQFVLKYKINTVMEFGCGDGNQLMHCNYPVYLGFDISPDAIARCQELFAGDDSKTYKLMKEYNGETADLTLSLDVIFHLTEDQIFTEYMHRLFDASQKYVIIYSSNTDANSITDGAHVKHRKFSKWVKRSKPEWKLLKHIHNRYPIEEDSRNGSPSDFFIYHRHDKTSSG
ncbi:hypothetical protein BH23BAC3_BH23BAC3_18000 [soil metagenome]